MMHFDYYKDELSIYAENDLMKEKDKITLWESQEGLCFQLNEEYELVKVDGLYKTYIISKKKIENRFIIKRDKKQ